MRIFLGLMAMAWLVGCGSGNTVVPATAPVASGPVQFGVAQGTRINLNSFSTSLKTDTLTLTKPEPDFWLKARDPETAEVQLRYGVDRDAYDGRRNHTMALTDRIFRGVEGRSGTSSFAEPEKDLEDGVSTRTLSVFDITNDVLTHGIFFTDDTGTRGSFHEAHAYAGGEGASNVPTTGTARYTGVFLGNIAEVGAAPNANVIEMDAQLDIDFGANTFAGQIGTGGAADITLTGTRFTSTGTGTGGRQLGGTAEITTGALGLAVGRTGPIEGRIFGDGATGAAGALSIEDGTGGARKVLVGSFGVTQ